jgi:predicted nucleic-acid-binding Zn-ribbon protein
MYNAAIQPRSFYMKNGKCPKCGSGQIFVSDAPFSDSVTIKANTKSVESFPSTAYLCVDCRYIEIYASETSVALFMKGKPLKDCIATAENWKKVSA